MGARSLTQSSSMPSSCLGGMTTLLIQWRWKCRLIIRSLSVSLSSSSSLNMDFEAVQHRQEWMQASLLSTQSSSSSTNTSLINMGTILLEGNRMLNQLQRWRRRQWSRLQLLSDTNRSTSSLSLVGRHPGLPISMRTASKALVT